jgi:hypothetical protein
MLIKKDCVYFLLCYSDQAAVSAVPPVSTEASATNAASEPIAGALDPPSQSGESQQLILDFLPERPAPIDVTTILGRLEILLSLQFVKICRKISVNFSIFLQLIRLDYF